MISSYLMQSSALIQDKPRCSFDHFRSRKNAGITVAAFCTFLCFRATSPHRSASAVLRRCHLPVDPVERQLHQRGRTHHSEGSGVPDFKWELVWHPARGLHELQDRAPGSWHRVRNQRVADKARRRRNRISWPSAQNEDKVCWWVLRRGPTVVSIVLGLRMWVIALAGCRD